MTAVITPIDEFLARQAAGTAVETFSDRHDADLLPPDQRWYADRLPVAEPGVGEQYAFRVDLDRCTGCKGCVAACHSLNGLDEAESWRFAGHLVSTDPDRPRSQTVPSGCHHCVDPACLSGCPTNAYEKDPITGIVRHLDDQCIGCSYCELTCPYEVPTYNKRLGIVRKCDMCADRLADGEAPACVQGCPTSAITITLVETAAVRVASIDGTLVPGAPASSLTTPTTQYVSREPLTDDVEAVDRHALQLAHSHFPLAVMLVLTQLSVGALAATVMADLLAVDLPAAAPVAAAIAGVVAIGASLGHLGRPLVAWRAVLGLRHSWLSREIVTFGLYAPTAVAYGVVVAADGLPGAAGTTLGLVALASGIGGVGCSALIYAVTSRTWWQLPYTIPKFVGTAAHLGPLFLIVVLETAGYLGAAPSDPAVIRTLALLAGLGATAKLVAEASFLTRARTTPESDLGRTARLLLGATATHTRWRFGLGTLGGPLAAIAIVAATAADADASALVLVSATALVASLAAELIERWQFFVACAAPRMPGVYRP